MCIRICFGLFLLLRAAGASSATGVPQSCDVSDDLLDAVNEPTEVNPTQAADETDCGLSLLQRHAEVVRKTSLASPSQKILGALQSKIVSIAHSVDSLKATSGSPTVASVFGGHSINFKLIASIVALSAFLPVLLSMGLSQADEALCQDNSNAAAAKECSICGSPTTPKKPWISSPREGEWQLSGMSPTEQEQSPSRQMSPTSSRGLGVRSAGLFGTGFSETPVPSPSRRGLASSPLHSPIHSFLSQPTEGPGALEGPGDPPPLDLDEDDLMPRQLSAMVEEDYGKTTLNGATMHICKVLMGVCFVGLPCAMGKGGFLAFFGLFVVVCINGFTAILVTRLLDVTDAHAMKDNVPETERDWTFLGYLAFGEAGRAIFGAIFVAELWFAMIFMSIMNGTNFSILLPGISKEQGNALCGLLTFLTLLPSQDWLVYTSTIGVAAAVLALVSLIWSANDMTAWQIEVAPQSLLWISWGNITYSVGVFQSCVGLFHPLIPSMYFGMRKPSEEFAPAVNRGFAVTLSMFLMIAIFAFFVYGPQAQDSFLSNLGREVNLQKIPGKAYLYLVCTSFYAVSVQTSCPLLGAPIIALSEKVIGITNSSVVIRTLWKAVFLTVTTFVGVALNGCLSSVQSLYGTLLATFSCIILPVIVSMRLLQFSLGIKVAMSIALVYAAYVLVWGTYTNIVEIVQTVGASAHPKL